MEYQNAKYQLNILTSEQNMFYEKFDSHHKGDSGVDLFNKELQVEPFQIGTIDFNIKCEMINLENACLTSYYLVPRSSISNTPFQLANSIGIIDAGYRGNIMAKIRNIDIKQNTLSSGSYFQIIAPDLKPIKIRIVNQLSESTRNEGFGSTKKNI
jgi:dUTP pyrophosphatase